MEIPFSSAAKRGDVFIAVPITVALALPPHCSIYFREIGPLSAREPAKASPKPSRMDFLPSSMTSAGILSYLVCRTNCPTYCVNPGAFGKSTAGTTPVPPEPFASARAPSEGAASNVAPSSPKDVLPNSRLRIVHLEAAHAMAGPRRRALRLPYPRDAGRRDNSDSTPVREHRSSRGMQLELWPEARSGPHLFVGIHRATRRQRDICVYAARHKLRRPPGPRLAAPR